MTETENADSIFQQAQKLLTAMPPDYATALPLLEQAAEAGHAEAAFQLGGCMQYGMGTDPNRVQATYWLRKAAEGGHTTARYNLALLREDNGINIQSVLPAYLSLAEEGHTDAQVRVMHYYAEQKDDRALYWAKQAAQKHHPQAQLFLAQHYQKDGSINLPAAHQLYQQAAAQGIVSAHWQLANQFLHGQGVVKNHTQALYHLRIAADAGIPAAQAELGKLLLEGQHLPADPEEGIKWINKAARHNHPDALCLLGDIRQYGLGIHADLEKARSYYEHAVKYGSLVAMQRLLMLDSRSHVANPTYNQEVLEFQQSVERNYQSGFALHYGIGVPQDFESAFAYYSLAARNGHPKAQTNLGMMYYNGEGIEADPKQAARWFTQAATQGDTTAQYNLACLHYSGTGVPQDTAVACKWLQTAIDSGHEHPEQLRELIHQWRENP